MNTFGRLSKHVWASVLIILKLAAAAVFAYLTFASTIATKWIFLDLYYGRGVDWEGVLKHVLEHWGIIASLISGDWSLLDVTAVLGDLYMGIAFAFWCWVLFHRRRRMAHP